MSFSPLSTMRTGRPAGVSVVDFMATTCHLLGIDYKKEVDTPAGRPVRIVDKGEKLISELLG
jgi:hypothetical protein